MKILPFLQEEQKHKKSDFQDLLKDADHWWSLNMLLPKQLLWICRKNFQFNTHEKRQLHESACNASPVNSRDHIREN